MLMEHFDDVVTDPSVRLAAVREHMAGPLAAERFRGRYWVAMTAGSTGRPGVFLHDSDEWATVLASYARANDWAGVPAGLTHRQRTAVVSSRTPWHQSAIVGRTLEGRLVRTLRLDATDPLDHLVHDLNAFEPESLVGYASILNSLALEQLAGRLRIAPVAEFSASEVLTTDARRRMRAAWGVEPFDVYAATEPAGLASECEHHVRHLYEDLVVVEIVDERNQPVPAGVVGAKVLVTVLFRRSQPLIRYEMSDRIAWLDKPCACGRPFAVVGPVEGRLEEVLQMPGPSGRVAVHPNILGKVFEVAAAPEWQVEQQADDALLVRIAGSSDGVDDQRLVSNLSNAVAATGALPPRVSVEHVAAIPRTKLGKAPLVRAHRPDAEVRPGPITNGVRT
jgi:phenylacetate-coenzyme A ligase PaaK-like adenylate-forming protein